MISTVISCSETQGEMTKGTYYGDYTYGGVSAGTGYTHVEKVNDNMVNIIIDLTPVYVDTFNNLLLTDHIGEQSSFYYTSAMDTLSGAANSKGHISWILKNSAGYSMFNGYK